MFRGLDTEFHHILIHTGQHYDVQLSEVFFKELGIRNPDYILESGKSCKNHYEQLAYLSVEIPRLLRKENIQPDLVLFLGDSNTVGVSFPLKKEGYRIGHIEAGMRSYDKRMLEEINRTVCDHCSDVLFVYHEDYKKQLEKENITSNVYIVGNTIVEPLRRFHSNITRLPKRNDMILMDIHRPENFSYPHRLKNIFVFGNTCQEKFGIPVKLLYFKRLKDAIEKDNLDLGKITMIPLLPYTEYLETVYHSSFLISDSGTGQEEPALLQTPVIVPRDYTERPQSYAHHCSIRLEVEKDLNCTEVWDWLSALKKGSLQMDVSWLGEGTTSQTILRYLHEFFEK